MQLRPGSTFGISRLEPPHRGPRRPRHVKGLQEWFRRTDPEQWPGDWVFELCDAGRRQGAAQRSLELSRPLSGCVSTITRRSLGHGQAHQLPHEHDEHDSRPNCCIAREQQPGSEAVIDRRPSTPLSQRDRQQRPVLEGRGAASTASSCSKCGRRRPHVPGTRSCR